MRQNGWHAVKSIFASAVCAFTITGFSAMAVAEEPSKAATSLRVELNKIEAAGENCRTYFLIDNRQQEAWRSLKLDLFALDKDGVAAKRLAVEVGPVPGRKTLIKLFDFPGLSCPQIGSVLLNDVVACEGAGTSREECLATIETTSKVDSVSFAK
ncbi:Tat pathway signal protein [Microvirga makkahensis]|uniref:Tat pathway signal protein n=1 Tax=Microvirga makkahensis TaxID=1128670 RepID=UPI00197C3559|nr:Tat pathway signal protein [Microvirga makkahensis]